MEKAHLYRNASGFRVTRHSFSAGDAWRYCHRKYYWARIAGWKERKQSAAMVFGNCTEAGISHHCLTGESAVAAFEKKWAEYNPDIDKTCAHLLEGLGPCEICKNKAKANAALEYAKYERDWATMLKIGRDLMRLFEVRLPGLPFRSPRFQRELRKEVFPGSKYAGLEFTAYLDIVSTAPADHPLLPKLEGVTPENVTLITDIKTTGARTDNIPENLIGLDQQAISYVWLTQIPLFAFLFLEKHGVEIKSGSRVTSFVPLSIAGKEYPAASEFYVAEVEDDGRVLLVPEESDYNKLKEVRDAFDNGLKAALKGLRGKVREEKEAEYRSANVDNSGDVISQYGTRTLPENVTTQRIVFKATRIPTERAQRVGTSIGREMVDIYHENLKLDSPDPLVKIGAFPEQGGVRFPNAKCLDCAYRGLCIGDDALTNELLIKTGEEWLEEAA